MEEVCDICGKSGPDLRLVQQRMGWGRSHTGYEAARLRCRPCRFVSHGQWRYPTDAAAAEGRKKNAQIRKEQ